MSRARLHAHTLALQGHGQAGRFRASLPPGAAGCWCRLTVGLAGAGGWWAKLEADDAARGQVVREAFLGPVRRSRGRRWRSTLVHMPAAAGGLTLHVFPAEAAETSAPLAVLRVLTRFEATAALLVHGWRLVPGALAGHPLGLLGRMRVTLGQAPARAGEVPPYAVWTALYTVWDGVTRAELTARTHGAAVDVVVVGGGGAGRAATLASLGAQWVRPAQTIVIDNPAAWVAGAGAWVLVLQAGETLAPQAIACFALATLRWPGAGGFYADVDSLILGKRADPLFKPNAADPWLRRSGLLTRGACVFRAHSLRAAAAASAEEWRREIAASLPADAFAGIPFVLTHLPAKPPAAKNVAFAGGDLPQVGIIVPTRARSGHVLRCLRRLLALTDYPCLDVILAVSRVDPGDRVQAANLARAREIPGVRVLDLGLQEFNYAAVNNHAARQARGDLLLLLNDDVVPIDPDWLKNLVAFTQGPAGESVDIVGARLLYGNGRVQHGGVIMGLAGLCEHAFRLAGRHDPGPHGLARLNRQVSAVTGACMVVRRSLYETLGGMDEGFAVALNDVDLCLRAGRLGRRVVFAADVAMIHYESLSLGRHYEGARAGLEASEVRRLRDRWADIIGADPFYNPSASLEAGREFQPGFPPRLTPLCWTRAEPPVQG